MADPARQDFEVGPTRIGGTGDAGAGGGGLPDRRRRVPIVLVIAIAIAIPTVAWIGPRIEWRPEVDLSFLRPTATPTRSATPRPTSPPTPGLATSLPAVTVAAGAHPTEPFPIDVNGLRLVDPATGELGPPMALRVAEDAVFTSADGDGWWCVCFDRRQAADRETASVEIRRVDAAGTTTWRQQVGEYVSTAPPPAQDFYIRFDLEISPDGNTAYLASGTRSGEHWTVAVDAIDLVAGTVSGHADLGTFSVAPIPEPSPPPDQGFIENYLAGPFIRLSQDGGRLLAWAWVDRYTPTGEQSSSASSAWMVDFDLSIGGGAIGRPQALGESAAESLRPCPWLAWTTPDELAAICWPSSAFPGAVEVAVLHSDGTELTRSGVSGASDRWLAEPILDLANRAVYLWQPSEHVFRRFDLDSGRTDRLELDPQASIGRSGGSSPDPAGPISPERPVWASFGSDGRLYYGPHLLPEPGGNRLFALGVREDVSGSRDGYTFGSSGIWVLDANQFALADRWAPVTAYGSIGLSTDGRWLLAAGYPGTDEDGNQANWQSSLTIHNTVDGRPALQLGSLGNDVQILQVPP